MLPKSPLSGFRHDRSARMRRRKIFLLLAVLLLCVMIIRGPILDVFAGTVHFVARPFWSFGQSLGERFSGYGELLRSKEEVVAENARLSAAIDLMAAESLTREALRRENEELKTKLGRDPEQELLLARVLATPGASWYDTLVIDIGETHGVFLGMRVMGDGDFVIGEVERVFNKSAVVALYSSSGYEFDVVVGTSSTPAKAQGQGGGNFRITLPRGIPIVEGDIAEIPALGPQYVGVVDKVDQPEGSSLQQIYLKWPFNIYELKWVYLAYEE